MTSNQIAYATLKEDERHHKATEDEDIRYHDQVKLLDEEKINISRDAARWDKEYKDRTTELTKQYNEYFFEMQRASLDEKAWYDQQLADIQKQQVLLDERNLFETERYHDMWAHNEQVRRDEDYRHNQALEQNDAYRNWLTERSQTYQRQQWEVENKLAFGDQEIKRQSLDITKEYNLMMAEQRGVENLLRKEELELAQKQYEESGKPLQESQRFKNISDAVTGPVNSATSIFRLITGGL